MRIGSRQLAGSIRHAVLISVCAAVVAMTSGLLLAIHVLSADHSAADHDSHDCAICQQLLILSKKALPAPAVDLVQQTPVLGQDVPDFVEHVEHLYLQISRPRGPPRSCLHQSV
jgi:hypothetical protein